MGTAFLKALCDEMRGVAKSMSKEFESLSKLSLGRPQTLQNRALGRYWEPKFGPEALPSGQETAESVQEVFKRRPRSPQDRPGAAQERAKAGQMTPKRAPNPCRIDL